MSDEEDRMELDGFVIEKCLTCGGGDGDDGMKVVACSVIGCPIGIHEECMSSNSEIDDKGRFYCPYCAYKRALLRKMKLRKKRDPHAKGGSDIPQLNQTDKVTEVLSETRKVPDSNPTEKAGSSAEPRNVPESGSEDLLFRISKRRKVNWTAAELEMLEAGIQIFSAQVKKNLPWRRILELGRDIFHETRTPDNLKDKWKVLCREASNNKQT
uniref:uncharacterized protein LOC101308008 n=1 Tax=Fragaria vesca subsp. vesca TaxID=101020 RepID=UPI0005CA3E1E|nr:PREDICTED: uncharacterized protein LOC101308008 [Fragaria vesca subsp. vesca]